MVFLRGIETQGCPPLIVEQPAAQSVAVTDPAGADRGQIGAFGSLRQNAAPGRHAALRGEELRREPEYQGKPGDAMEAFERSRDLLSDLYEKYPDIPELLFELGNAEYYIGNLFYMQGRYESAMESMQKYHRLTRKLLDTDPDNPDWITSLNIYDFK